MDPLASVRILSELWPGVGEKRAVPGWWCGLLLPGWSLPGTWWQDAAPGAGRLCFLAYIVTSSGNFHSFVGLKVSLHLQSYSGECEVALLPGMCCQRSWRDVWWSSGQMMEWKSVPVKVGALKDSLKHSGLVNQRFFKVHVACEACIRSEIHIGTDLKTQFSIVLFYNRVGRLGVCLYHL